MKDYYTVDEYADVVEKDPGNIRRLLISGAIKGEKCGRIWMIPKDAKYPEDGRIKSGNYKNWRKKMAINRNRPILMKALGRMSLELSTIYGALLDRIILYGSYARMEETPESDVDIAILLRNGSTEKMHDDMIDIVVDYELELGLVLSVVSIDYQNYSMWKKVLPYYKKINGEGILLWKAA